MKKVFKRFLGGLRYAFTSVSAFVADHITPALETAEKIKSALESPIADIITTVIPTDTDDNLKAWITKNLCKAIDVVAPVASIINEPDTGKKIQAIVKLLKEQSPSMRKGILQRLASEMATSSAGEDKVKGHSVDLLCQMEYSKKVEGINADIVEPVYCNHCGNPQ